MLSATDAEAGLTLARDEQPHLILMDIQLPGMDGLEATRLLKQDDATRAIPVIALTALAMKGDEERIRAAGCDGYIAKPLAYKDFLAVIAARLVDAVALGRLSGLTMTIRPDITDHPARVLMDDEPHNRTVLLSPTASARGGGGRRDGAPAALRLPRCRPLRGNGPLLCRPICGRFGRLAPHRLRSWKLGQPFGRPGHVFAARTGARKDDRHIARAVRDEVGLSTDEQSLERVGLFVEDRRS